MAAPATPVINKPYGSGTGTSVQYSTNIVSQQVTGTVDTATYNITVTATGPTISNVEIDLDEHTWSFDVVLISGENVITIKAVGIDNAQSIAATLTTNLVQDGSLGFLVNAPTGISMNRYASKVEFLLTHVEDVNATNPTTLVTGFNFYASISPGGGLDGYTLLNVSLVDDYKEYAENVISTTQTTDRVAIINGVTETVTTVSTIEYQYKYSFFHIRTNGPDDDTYPQRQEAQELFSVVANTQELYYVATAVAYDPDLSVEYESVYTSELTGLPVILSTRIKDLTPRTLNTIQQDLITEILRVQSNIDIRPGSVTRDIHVDPPAWEANRLWFIIDFVSRSQSFLTLFQIDDPNGSGSSVLYSDSKYKQALAKAMSLTEQETQTLIDESFEKLAMNSLTSRLGSEKSIGQAILQRTTAPTQDIVALVGTVFQSKTNTSTVNFVSTITKTMSSASASSYLNTATGYYELTIPIEAVTAGSSGNVAAGSISSSNASGFSKVTNREATSFGRDKESNTSLAERAMLSYVSVDTGTSGGYLRAALDTSGVHRARVVEADEDLMMRDWDDVRGKHIGGKVDLWVQGTALVEVEETFAFKYNQDLNVRFVAVGEASDLTFRTTSSNVTQSTPLFAMLDDADVGYGLRNSSTGEDFDLTGVTVVDYRTIQLDTDRPQPDVSEDDLVLGDYKYRDSDPFIPTKQPINSISSIVSDTSTLTSANYSLVKSEDPLLFGYSVEASDQINIVQANGIPTGSSINVEDEEIVLVGTSAVSLASVGVDMSTIVVTNASGTITYVSDIEDSSDPDYYLTAGSLTTAPKIARSDAGNITNGSKVLVSYTAEENFKVTYSVNNVLQLVAAKVDKKRHVTADVLTKQSIENEVVIACTVVLKDNADQADIDKQIRTNLSYLINRLQIGEDLHQSDVVHVIKEVPEVSYVVQPLTRMHKSDGSLILRDDLDSDATMVVEGQTADVWLLSQQLTFSTSTGGGPSTTHRGVFQNEQPLSLYDQEGDFNELKSNPYSSLIIGADGILITGYTTEENKEGLTANRVFVSLPKGETPEGSTWSVTYIVDGESGTSDIEAFVMEYLTLGEVVITYTTNADAFGNDF